IVISQRSGNTTILVDGRSGFTGSVSLTATGSSQGPSVSLNPTSVSLTNGDSATSVLTAVAPFATSTEDDFEITIPGTSGTISRPMSVPRHEFLHYHHTPHLINREVYTGTSIALGSQALPTSLSLETTSSRTASHSSVTIIRRRTTGTADTPWGATTGPTIQVPWTIVAGPVRISARTLTV